jgi:hypothetical protein
MSGITLGVGVAVGDADAVRDGVGEGDSVGVTMAVGDGDGVTVLTGAHAVATKSATRSRLMQLP